MIRAIALLFIFVLYHSNIIAQTYSWSGYTAGSMSYTTGIMTSTVTSSSPGFQYSSPRHYAGSTVGGGFCGIAGGLALEQLFGNITSAFVNLNMSFTSNNTTNGTCASISFQIKDINADESYQTFRDFIYISATDGNNIAIPVASITATGGSNKTITTSGGTTRIIAGSSGSYGSRSQTACDNITITITPPAGTPLKSINIRWQPSYETCNNCYWSWSSPNRPAYQYISISGLTATATGGCAVLPVELTKFIGDCEMETKNLEWETASETNNRFFYIEGSEDGETFNTLDKLDGAGNSAHANSYQWKTKNDSNKFNYFRLKQEDVDGKSQYSEIIEVYCKNEMEVSVYPNPANENLFLSMSDEINLDRIEIYDLTGRIVMQKNYSENNSKLLELNIQELSTAYYTMGLIDKNNSLVKTVKFAKE
jgi:hypothetical protein